ncbi:hypothetical protein CRYUN_Cryun26dG0053900 [Craigia yunnanensis]
MGPVRLYPGLVQSRILSFLALENKRFNRKESSKLALSESNVNEWIAGFNLDSGEETVDKEFESLPDWLKDIAADNDPLLSWLPSSVADFVPRFCDDSLENDQSLFSQVEENGEK